MPTLHHSNFEAIALDFDGTLADTDKAHTDARLLAYEQLAVELKEPELATVDPEIHAAAHHHGSDALSINAWVIAESGIVRRGEGIGLAKAIVKRKTENYHEAAKEGLDAMPGAIEFTKLAQRVWGEKIFIVTTAHRDEEVVPFLGRHGLRCAFANRQLITREDVENLKPHPEAYELLLGRLGIRAAPERLLVVENTPNGVEAARSTGATVVAMLTPDYRQSLLKQQGYRKADVFTEDFEELGDMIKPE